MENIHPIRTLEALEGSSQTQTLNQAATLKRVSCLEVTEGTF